MEMQLNYTDVFSPEIIYENYIEDKLEHDLVIPDYLCSAQKIIHCEADAVILNKTLTDDKITLDGVCIWKIMYMSEEDSLIHCTTCERPFTEHFGISQSAGTLRYKIKIKNVVCKLHSPQKASCKATLCIAVQLTGNKSQTIVAGTSDDELQLCRRVSDAVIPVEECEREFKVVGEIALKNRREVEVHKAHSTLIIKERRCLDDKVIIKGVCKSNVVLISKEDCFAECVETETSFNQVFDVTGVNEKCIATAIVDAMECDTSINSEDGQQLLMVNTTVVAQISVFNSKQLCFITDAYHPTFDIKSETQTVPYYSQILCTDMPVHCTQNVRMQTNGIDMLYTEVDGEVEKISVQDDLMIIEGKVNISFVSLLEDEVSRNTYSIPFQTTRKSEGAFERLKCDATIAIDNLNYLILNDTEVEVNCDCKIALTAYMIEEQQTFVRLEQLGERQEHPMSSPLVIYYGAAGENLWDIGKKYGVPISVLKENNEIEQDVLEEEKLIFISKR